MGRPFRKGGDPRQGRGPKKGHGGRPPLAYREALKAMEPLALRTVELAVKGGPPDIRLRAAQDVLNRLHGKPTQPIDATITGLADILAAAFSEEAPGEVG